MAEVTMPDPNELPPNSHVYHREKENEPKDIPEKAEKKIEKVITGNVKRKKKSLGRRFIDTFLKDGDNIDDIKVYILEEVVVPSILEMIHDSVDDGISMLFGLGTSRRKSSGRGQTVSKVNYQGCFNGNKKQDRSSKPARDPNRHDNLDDFYFETRIEAEQARDALFEMLDTYQQVTVADYLDLIGVTSEDFTDNKWGWTDLGPLNVKATRNGYRLELPRETPLGR